jgi:hypothetical protein
MVLETIYATHHPNGQQSGSVSTPRRAVVPGSVQKRKATESVTNGITGTDDVDRAHALKRQRNDAACHRDFWYPDGSVVILVENTKFRLCQSMLKKQSAYFAAAFAKDGERAYLEVEIEIDARNSNGDRLPVHHVHLPAYRVVETTADDFAMLLTVVEKQLILLSSIDIDKVPFLAGVLRAACALSFEAQRKRDAYVVCGVAYPHTRPNATCGRRA